jgi:hypothetical protein
LLPECLLNRNDWFMLHKLQHTKWFLLRSCHYHCVTSQTEREEGSGNAYVHKTEHLLFHSTWETYFCVCFQKCNGRLKSLHSFWYTLYFQDFSITHTFRIVSDYVKAKTYIFESLGACRR